MNTIDINNLSSIARLAWGSGMFEGTSGGKGNMGVVTNRDGSLRVIKFNTHFGERKLFGGASADEVAASDKLREQLLGIAKDFNVKPEVLRDIRKTLGLDPTGEATGTQTLLDRTTVAKVVAKIDDKVWERALKDKDGSEYSMSYHKSSEESGSMTFENVKQEDAVQHKGIVHDVLLSREIAQAMNAEKAAFLQTELGAGLSPEAKNLLGRAIDFAIEQRAKAGPRKANEDFANLARLNIMNVILAYNGKIDAKAYMTSQGFGEAFANSSFDTTIWSFMERLRNDIVRDPKAKGVLDRFVMELNVNFNGNVIPSASLKDARYTIFETGCASARAFEKGILVPSKLDTWEVVDDTGEFRSASEQLKRERIDTKYGAYPQEQKFDAAEFFADLANDINGVPKDEVVRIGAEVLSDCFDGKTKIHASNCRKFAYAPILAANMAKKLSNVLKAGANPDEAALALHGEFQKFCNHLRADRLLKNSLPLNDVGETTFFSGFVVRLACAQLSVEELGILRDQIQNNPAMRNTMFHYFSGQSVENRLTDKSHCIESLNMIAHLLRQLGLDPNVIMEKREDEQVALPPLNVFLSAPDKMVRFEIDALKQFADQDNGLFDADHLTPESRVKELLEQAQRSGTQIPPLREGDLERLGARYDEIIARAAKHLHHETNGASADEAYVFDLNPCYEALKKSAVEVYNEMM